MLLIKKVARTVKTLGTILAVILILLGLIVLPLPLPFGTIMVLVGVAIAVLCNNTVRVFVRDIRTQHPKLEKVIVHLKQFLPRVLKRAIDLTAPLRQKTKSIQKKYISKK